MYANTWRIFSANSIRCTLHISTYPSFDRQRNASIHFLSTLNSQLMVSIHNNSTHFVHKMHTFTYTYTHTLSDRLNIEMWKTRKRAISPWEKWTRCCCCCCCCTHKCIHYLMKFLFPFFFSFIVCPVSILFVTRKASRTAEQRTVDTVSLVPQLKRKQITTNNISCISPG